MTYSMKSKKKLEGDSNFRAWKKRIYLILSKNKVLDIVKGNIVEQQFEEGKENEPHNIEIMGKLKDKHQYMKNSYDDIRSATWICFSLSFATMS